MTNLYQFEYLHSGALDPCCYSMTYNVTKEKNSEKLVLNGVLNQRSQDVLAANNWNVCQYALLLMMVAQVNDMVPGELVHVIADAHIYDLSLIHIYQDCLQERVCFSIMAFPLKVDAVVWLMRFQNQ